MILRKGKTGSRQTLTDNERYVTNIFWYKFPLQDVLYCSTYGATAKESSIRADDIIKAMRHELSYEEGAA